jgi:hypothetical protein
LRRSRKCHLEKFDIADYLMPEHEHLAKRLANVDTLDCDLSRVMAVATASLIDQDTSLPSAMTRSVHRSNEQATRLMLP